MSLIFCKTKEMASFICVLGITVFLFAACAFPVHTPGGGSQGITDLSKSVTFREISQQGFMGGSILYNPDKPSTGQLSKNVTVAVRLGYVEAEKVNADETLFVDIPERAQFGTLVVDSIDANNISFSVSLSDKDGNFLKSGIYSLQLNDMADINNDGYPDIEYKQPARKREGFESAVYLTFLSSQETCNTAMFAILPQQYARNTYPSGIIGINPDGKFILSKYETDDGSRRTLVYGVQKGDYVLDELEGKYQRVVYPINSRSARNISDAELEDIDVDAEPVYYPFTEEEFGGVYNAEVLFSALPEILKAEDGGAGSYVERLNAILLKRDLISVISQYQEVNVPQDQLTAVMEQISSLTNDDLIGLNRKFLEENYPALCPQIVVETSCFTEVLPLSSVLIGCENIDTQIVDNETRVASVSDYESQRNALINQFSNFKVLYTKNLTPPSIPMNGTGSEVDVKFDNSYFALGIRGSFSSSWGNVKASVEGVVFITADTDVTANVSFEKNLFDQPIFRLNQPVLCFGPIVLALNVDVRFSIPLEISIPVDTTFKMRAAVTGMYGAGVEAGLRYGVNWKKKWFIRYPVPYADFNSNKWAYDHTTYYVGTDSINSVSFHGIKASIHPAVNAAFGANISRVLWADINAGLGVKSELCIDYAKSILTGNAAMYSTAKVSASASIGIKDVPFIGFLGKTWDFNILDYSKPIANWQVFKTNL